MRQWVHRAIATIEADFQRSADTHLIRTRLCVADPDNSVFYDHFHSGDPDLLLETSSNIEGIGRPSPLDWPGRRPDAKIA